MQSPTNLTALRIRLQRFTDQHGSLSKKLAWLTIPSQAPQRNATTVTKKSQDRTDPIAALRERGYLLYLAGSLLSNTGNQMRTVAVGWEIYDRTHQPLNLGLIGLVLALPVILLALPAGAAADRYPRKTLIMLAQGGLAASGFGLAWASFTRAPVSLMYLFLLGTGASGAVHGLAGGNGDCGRTGSSANLLQRSHVAKHVVSAIGNAGTARRWLSIGGMESSCRLSGRCCIEPGATSFARFRKAIGTSRERPSHLPVAAFATRDSIPERQQVILSTMVLDMVAVIVWRRHRTTADLCNRHPWRRTDRVRLDAGDAVSGCDVHGCGACHSTGIPAQWTNAFVGRDRFWHSNDRLRPLGVIRAVAGGIIRVRHADNISVIIRGPTVLQLSTPDSIAVECWL